MSVGLGLGLVFVHLFRFSILCAFLVFLCSCVFRPHRSTTCIDATYCYRPSGVVCLSVCLSDTLVDPAKMAELIEMPFGLLARMGHRNHVLDGVQRC